MAYGRIEETFWHDPKIRALSEDGRNLMLYLLTCPHKNRLGCFALDPYYAAADLQWNPDRVAEALVELNDRDRIAWDPDHRVVLIRRFLRYNTLENPNVVIGATNDLKALPDTPLLSVLSTVLEETKKSFYLPLLQELRNRLANSYPNGYPNGLPNPDHTRPYHTRPTLLRRVTRARARGSPKAIVGETMQGSSRFGSQTTTPTWSHGSWRPWAPTPKPSRAFFGLSGPRAPRASESWRSWTPTNSEAPWQRASKP